MVTWGEYGQPGQCPNCLSYGFFGAEDEKFIYPTAAPNYPPKHDDYKKRSNWRCWNCTEERA